MQEREAMISQLERANEEMWRSGLCEKWFEGCDAATRRVAGRFNGPLMYALLSAAGYEDAACTDLMRHGARSPSSLLVLIVCALLALAQAQI